MSVLCFFCNYTLEGRIEDEWLLGYLGMGCSLIEWLLSVSAADTSALGQGNIPML
jgi:hypothetical protein